MELFLDCLPCVLRQALEASRIASDDIKVQNGIMIEAIGIIGKFQSYRNSPEIVREIHKLVIRRTGISDIYRKIKTRDIQTALRVYPQLKQFVDDKKDRLYWALKVAATGNSLDSVINSGYDIEGNLDKELIKPFAICDSRIFKRQLKVAKCLLVIGDNAGETVFDRIILEQFKDFEIIYAVRSAPIINDAIAEDAIASKIERQARIISTGCDMPGVLLEECSEAFLKIFHRADIVISKGQGNYETLSNCGRGIYFLLKAKCPLISSLLGVGINEYVFKYLDCGSATKQSSVG